MFESFQVTQSARKAAACQLQRSDAPLGSSVGAQKPHTAPLRQADTDESESRWRLRCKERAVSSETLAGECRIKSHGEKQRATADARQVRCVSAVTDLPSFTHAVRRQKENAAKHASIWNI